jgi:flagellar basal-body rod protein FlgB
MFNSAITGKTEIPLLHRCLDAYSMRHNAIANNVANVEVPGYSRVRVKFEDKLRKALFDRRQVLEVTDDKHIGGGERNIEQVRPAAEVDISDPGLNGINNVDIDLEMAELAKNNLDYSTAAMLMRHEFTRFRLAISGGSGGR